MATTGSRNLPAARQSKPPATATGKSPVKSRTINVTYNIGEESKQGSYSGPSGGTGMREGSGYNWLKGYLAAQPRNAPTPKGIPRFLGNQKIIVYSWLVAMVVIGFDEWHNNGILPRPIRLWDTSLVFGLLALVGFIEPVTPIANALAIGYVIMLIWQYYDGGGQFSHRKG